MTVIFFGEATLARTTNHIDYHVDWPTPIPPSPSQYFRIGTACSDFDEERASDPDIGVDRYHIRLATGSETDGALGTMTAGTPHFEEWVQWNPNCNYGLGGHAVTSNGFTDAREQLEAALDEPHHSWYEEFAGNTDTIVQCNGNTASSDGYVDYIYVPATIFHLQ